MDLGYEVDATQIRTGKNSFRSQNPSNERCSMNPAANNWRRKSIDDPSNDTEQLLAASERMRKSMVGYIRQMSLEHNVMVMIPGITGVVHMQYEAQKSERESVENPSSTLLTAGARWGW